MIEQNLLPFRFEIFEAKTCRDTCNAIKNMTVRGAGAMGAAAAYAMAQAVMTSGSPEEIEKARNEIKSTRPTAQNLFYAVERVYTAAKKAGFSAKAAAEEASTIANAEVEAGRKIGELGEPLIRDGANVLTHCNAGWLAFVDHGSALAPVYLAKERGKQVFVYADETRPRGQGARLTAWELSNANIPHAIIADGAGAHFMSKGKVDLVIVGADRIAANGDTANKIGTLDKAIVASEFGIPFYVAAPSYTIDTGCRDGASIPIEERAEDEILYQTGMTEAGEMMKVRVSDPGSKAINPAFDVTPAKYITGIITEKAIIMAAPEDIKRIAG